MNNVGKRMGMAELLTRHPRIQIPMIQRDYAQGRESASEIRNLFLDALENALNPNGNSSNPLNLDFIYGSVEGDQRNYFAPLDGQQRLTTLFLLHWYLAWADSEWETFSGLFRDGDDCRFSYDVRPSSEEFFDKLVRYMPARRPGEIHNLQAVIINQSWFLRYYDRDPTIQSALSMLDAIHARFKTSTGLFQRLTNAIAPAITFQLLDLENFGLSDDLYIKMNARGKQLTPFETFKARYEQELEGQFSGVTRRIEDQDFCIAEFVARRMDTKWADLFWIHRDKKSNLYDDAVMNIFRVVALVSRNPESKTYLKDVALLRDEVTPPSYSTFHSQGWLDPDFTEILISLLESWSAAGGFTKLLLPDARYFDEKKIFEKLIKSPVSLTLPEVIQFSGYALFIRTHEQSLDSNAFQEWMRVVYNLALNSYIERPDQLRSTARGLRELLPKSTIILEHFSQLTAKADVSGFAAQQVKEETLKAGLILNHAAWRPLIDRAEGHGYFLGQIEFLCEFSGAAEQWRTTEGFTWDKTTHLRLQARFEDYLKKAEAMFNSQGLVPLKEYRWQRALLAVGDYLLPSGINWSLLVNSSTDPASWKRLLRGTGPYVPEKRPFIQQLWDRLTTDRPFAEQLDEIISAASNLDPWQEAVVGTPKAVEYCASRAMRFEYNPESVYLLWKSRMSGAHVELFTYCLYHNSLLALESKGLLQPLNQAYREIAGSYDKPHILLTFLFRKNCLCFRIDFKNGSFHTSITKESLATLPELQTLLCETGGFKEMELCLVKVASPGNIEKLLKELAGLLATISEEAPDHD